MYAVIKTGGKQYRVRAGDLLVVEKLDGKPGAKLAFDEVLLIGEGADVTLGAPTVAGASVSATLVETRKGEKIKVFKKIRRQGYRRTQGHRQFQSVLRITALAGGGASETWDGEVDLTPLAELNARARNLARGMEAARARRAGSSPKLVKAKAQAKPVKAAAAAKPALTKAPAVKAAAPAKVETKKAETGKAQAKKAEAKRAETGKLAPKAAKPAAASKNAVAKPAKAEAPKGAPKKPAAKKAAAKAAKPAKGKK